MLVEAAFVHVSQLNVPVSCELAEFFYRHDTQRISLGYLRTGLAHPKTQFPEQPMALTHPETHPVALLQGLREEIAVPEVVPKPELAWGAAKPPGQALPLARMEPTGVPAALALAQTVEPLCLRGLHPALDRARILIEEPGHRAGALALVHLLGGCPAVAPAGTAAQQFDFRFSITTSHGQRRTPIAKFRTTQRPAIREATSLGAR